MTAISRRNFLLAGGAVLAIPPLEIAIRGGKLYAVDNGAKAVIECDLASGAQQTLAAMPDNLKRPKGVALQVIGVGLIYNKEVYSDQ